MKFDLPVGASVIALLPQFKEDGEKKRKKQWVVCNVTEIEEKHRLVVDAFTRSISFGSVRIDSYVMNEEGKLVEQRLKIHVAAEMIYSAKPLWWYDRIEQRQRAATVLEVWLFQRSLVSFVPYEGWRLFDERTGKESFPRTSDVRVWRTPIKITRSPDDAVEEFMGPRREKIAELQKQYDEAKETARLAAREVTRIRLKLNAMKRIR